MNYGASEWLAPQQLSAMVTTVAKLRGRTVSASAAGSDDVVINGINRWVDALDASRAKVESGQKSLTSWIADAENCEAFIDNELNEAHQSLIARFWNEVVAQSASDTVDAANNAAAQAKTALQFGVPLIALIVVGLVVLKVL